MIKFIKRNKFGNIKIAGFDSKKEAKRAAELEFLERKGLIGNLVKQHKFELASSFYDIAGKLEKGISYIADFTYHDLEGNRMICEDVKSPITKKDRAYIIKRKLFKLKYPHYYFIES